MERTDISQNAGALAPRASALNAGLVIYHYGDRKAILTRELAYEVRLPLPCPDSFGPQTAAGGIHRSQLLQYHRRHHRTLRDFP
jgi:hypothetical protein